MKKYLLSLIIVFMLFSLISCGTVEETPVVPNNPVIGGNENQNNNNNNNNNNNDQSGVTFTVSLSYNGELFIPTSEKIFVVWADEYSQYSAEILKDGYANITLDGDFNVYLENCPNNYTYNPNIYHANNENPEVVIELLRISKITKGKGTKLYEEYQMSDVGTYRSVIASKSKKVYYEYQPTKAGVYVVESLVNIHTQAINPKLDVYCGTFAYKTFTETIDTGGAYKTGGYSKNFKWKIYIAEEMIGNVYTFVVYATSQDDVYPVNVDFSITYEKDYSMDHIVSDIITATEYTTARPNNTDPSKPDYFDLKDYIYINSDGGFGNYYGSKTNGTGLLDGSNFKYNEEDGFWHYFDKETNTFGPILCAKITQPCAYYEESLNLIESHGNKNLTVSNGTENYKQFIENQYASVCNYDGVCYVTMELKEFLQKFSISQRLFFDGNGFVEATNVYAVEEDQWLFACGYYVEKK